MAGIFSIFAKKSIMLRQTTYTLKPICIFSSGTACEK